MDIRWLTDDEIVSLVNPALQARSMAELNVNPEQPTCRVLGALHDGVLVEAFAFQLLPVLGPMFKVDNTFRDNGDTSRALAAKMEEWMGEVSARGYLAIADSPVTERLCKRYEMTKVESPVFQKVG